jgi:hypothetical protein
MAKMTGKLNVFNDHHATWPSRRNHPLQSFFWFSQMRQHESCKNKVVSRGFFNLVGTSVLEINVQTTPLGFQTGQCQAAFIEVNAGNMASGPHGFRHLKRGSPDAATHVQAVHSLTQAYFFEKRPRGGPFDSSQKA